MENISDRKPYCVECPQVLMALALVIGLLGLLLVVLARGVELWTVECAFALIGLIVVGYKSKRGRRVLLGREVTTLVFTACLEAGIYNWEKVNEILATHEGGGYHDDVNDCF